MSPPAEGRDRRSGVRRVLIELGSADLRMGAVNDALDLAELAMPSGVRFLLCGPLTDEFCAEAGRRGIATWRRSSREFSRRAIVLYALDVLRWIVALATWRPDVVHLNYPGYGPSLACAARLLRKPVVARAGPYVPGNLSNRWVSAHLANCDAHAAALLDSPLRDRVVVTGDLFRPGRLQATMTLERPLPRKPDGTVRLVFIGQLVERKGLHVLMDALARVTTPWELLLAGGDWSQSGYPQIIKERVRSAGWQSRVVFENHRQDVGAILSTADLFVLPSLSEARPRSVIEAMAMGVAVVASDAGGIPSLITDGTTGVLARAGDAASLADAIERLAASPGLRARLGAAARTHVEQACRADRTAAAYVAVYDRVAGESPATGRTSRAAVPPSPQYAVVTQSHPLWPSMSPLRKAVAQAGTGECVAFAVPLDTPIVSRILTLATFRLQRRRAERAIRGSGGEVVAQFGVEPSLTRPFWCYELDTPASVYTERFMRPKGSHATLRRVARRWCGCDPALGGVLVVARKSC